MSQTGKIEANGLITTLTQLYKNKDSSSKVNDESFKTAFDEANQNGEGVSVDKLLEQLKSDTGISIDDFSQDEKNAINKTLEALSDGSDKMFDDYNDLVDISQSYYENLESSKVLENLDYSVSKTNDKVVVNKTETESTPSASTSEKKRVYNDGSYTKLIAVDGKYQVELFTKSGTSVLVRDLVDDDYKAFGITNPNAESDEIVTGAGSEDGDTEVIAAKPNEVQIPGTESTIDENALIEANDDETVEDFTCTDGNDDGKLGFSAALEEFGGGLLQGAKNALKNFVKSGGPAKLIGIGIACKVGVTVIAGTVAAPLLPVIGTVAAVGGLLYFGSKTLKAGINMCKNIGNAWDAKTDAEAKFYYNTAGNDGIEVAGNGVGALLSYKAAAKGIKAFAGKVNNFFSSKSSSASAGSSQPAKKGIFSKVSNWMKSKLPKKKIAPTPATPASNTTPPVSTASTAPIATPAPAASAPPVVTPTPVVSATPPVVTPTPVVSATPPASVPTIANVTYSHKQLKTISLGVEKKYGALRVQLKNGFDTSALSAQDNAIYNTILKSNNYREAISKYGKEAVVNFLENMKNV